MRLKLDSKEHIFSLSGAVLVAAAGLMACSHNQVKPEASADARPAAQAQATDAANAHKLSPTEQFKADGQADLDKALAQLKNVSVFFEYDAATLTKDAEDKLAAVGNVLVKHPELTVRIEGNCDERGSEAYNLALGQRRAEAARKYLDQLGVKSGQVTAISFGAEKPKAPGHDEESWKQNRRDDVSTAK